MPTQVEKLDPRICRGTFLLLMSSGAVYTIVADKKISGRVAVSGGSFNLKSEERLVETISVGRFMTLSSPTARTIYTSLVIAIYRIDNAPEDEINATITTHLAAAGASSW